MSTELWSPDSWRSLPIQKVPACPSAAVLSDAERQIAGFPPLAFPGETFRLKCALGKVAAGEAFLLQAGACAESFVEQTADNIRDSFRAFLQMATVITFGAALPVVKVGQIAGQFPMPGSAATNKHKPIELPAYQGDGVNGPDFSSVSGVPDPRRQLEAYRQSAATLNFIRAFTTGGYASLESMHHWMLRFMKDSLQVDRYQELADRISDTLGFMRAIGLNPETHPELRQIEFFTSHEALLLTYEQALTRCDPTTGGFYATSGHMIWIGERTRQLDHAHLEYCRGVKNPIGIKCGPTLKPDELLRLIDVLNPQDETGRLTLIARFGADKVGDLLPGLVRAVQRARRTVVWSCDPIHGNASMAGGYKARPFDRVMTEIHRFFAVLNAEGAFAGGLHLEMTAKNVSECTSDARAISKDNLPDQHHIHCDPRLNAKEVIEVAFLVSELLKAERVQRLECGPTRPNSGPLLSNIVASAGTGSCTAENQANGSWVGGFGNDH